MAKYRIIKHQDKFKIQERFMFWWKTWQHEDCDPLGFMYPPYDITFDTLEEAIENIPSQGKTQFQEVEEKPTPEQLKIEQWKEN